MLVSWRVELMPVRAIPAGLWCATLMVCKLDDSVHANGADNDILLFQDNQQSWASPAGASVVVAPIDPEFTRE